MVQENFNQKKKFLSEIKNIHYKTEEGVAHEIV